MEIVDERETQTTTTAKKLKKKTKQREKIARGNRSYSERVKAK